MSEVVFTMLWSLPLTFVPVKPTPDAGARDENSPNGELSNVMVFSAPRAAAAASKLAAEATEFGAVAREPAPSSAAVNREIPAPPTPSTHRRLASGSISVPRCGGQGLAVGRLQPENETGLRAGQDNFCGGFVGVRAPLEPGTLWLGTKEEDITLTVRPGSDHHGELQAWDPAT